MGSWKRGVSILQTPSDGGALTGQEFFSGNGAKCREQPGSRILGFYSKLSEAADDMAKQM